MLDMIHYPTFGGLLRSGAEFECDLTVGGVDMPATLVWGSDSTITPYGEETYAPVVNAPYKVLSNRDVEILCDDYRLGERFVMAHAGYIGMGEWERLFGVKQ